MAKKSRRAKQSQTSPKPSPKPASGKAKTPPAGGDGPPAAAAPERRRPRRGLWITAAVVLLVAAGVGAGLFHVRPGEVALARAGDGSVERTWEEGWHWRLPFSGELRRLPRQPIPIEHDVEITTPEGATIVVNVTGRLGVVAGGTRDWIAAAGWDPFVDALWRLMEQALEPAVRDTDPAEIFRSGSEERLTGILYQALDGAGLAVDTLTLAVPTEHNPVAAAVVRNRVAKLASPTGTKVLLIGWDGADWLMIRPLLRQGRMPNLQRLVDRGVSGELRSQMPLLSPLLWTTIATGKPVTEHGIADFLVTDPQTGGLVPISSASRQVHALWTLLPAFDLTTDVVAWWATWPAEPVRGTMVTDRVAYQLFEFRDDPSGEGKVYPPSAWENVQKMLVPAEEVPFEEVQRYVDVPRDQLEQRWNALPPERRQEDPVNHLRKILATTASYHAIALNLLEQQADLTMVYYEGTDTVGHLFARFLPPRMSVVSQEDVERYGRALPTFYEHADELLGELLDAVDDDTLVILVSDHGFFTGEARPASDPSDFAEGAPQWHRLYGILAAVGPGVSRGEIDGATILDVAPTVLARLGLPVPGDMPGRVLPELVPAAERPGEAELASYEVLPRARPARSSADEMDEERLRELVALGYISPAVLENRGRGDGGNGRNETGDARRAAAGPPPATAPSPGAGDLQAGATEAYNLGRIHMRQGELEQAEAQFRTAVTRLPSFGLGWASLAQVASQRGDHSRAFDYLAEGFTKSSSMPMSAVTGLVDEAKRVDRLADAGRVLARIPASYRSSSAYPAALGLLAEESGRPDEAMEHYRAALAIDPLDQLSVEQMVTLLRRQGREADAHAFLDQAFDRAAGQLDAMNRLSVVAVRQRWPEQAERMLRRVLASDPGNPGVLANLAAALAQQRKTGEALEVMQQAVERDPTNARNFFNLGAMLAERGRPREALTAFNQAAELGLRSPQVYVAAAKMRFQLGDREGAERELEQALEIDPGHAEARQLLGLLRSG